MEELIKKIQELIENIYNYDILRINVSLTDIINIYLIDVTFLLREEVSFNFPYSYDLSKSIEWNIKHIENIIDVFIIKICKYKDEK